MKTTCGRSVRLVAILVVLAGLGLSPGAEAQRGAERWKAVWEPVNYPADLRLHSVFFVTDRIGWIAGSGNGEQGGVLLYTSDGGDSWSIQLGDPNSNEQQFEKLYFLDSRHGWAARRHGKIVRTTDGKSWEDAGSFPEHTNIHTFRFVSTQAGFGIAGLYGDGRIYSTQDAGRNWKMDFQCVTQLQVQGLTRRVGCGLRDLAFPSPRVGYAVGGGDKFAVVAKTEDGGKSWAVVFASTDVDNIEAAFFTDEKRGVIRLHNNKVFLTEDGGQSWRGVTASAIDGRVKFADPSVGWACGARKCAVTTDGGRSWTSRDLHLPTDVRAFSAPRRDRVFLVGHHGMIYRYRVVPAEHTAQGIVAAPPVPGYGAELTTQLASLQSQVQQLEQKASSAQDDAFVQDTGFLQDVSTLETGAGTFSEQAPAFGSRYRNLNLFFVGMNMLDELSGRAAGIREAVDTLKSAKDRQSALAALQELNAKIDGAHGMISTGFQNLVAAGTPDVAGGAAPANMAAPAAAAAAPTPASAPPAGQTSKSNPSVDQAVGAAKSVFKKLLKF